MSTVLTPPRPLPAPPAAAPERAGPAPRSPRAPRLGARAAVTAMRSAGGRLVVLPAKAPARAA